MRLLVDTQILLWQLVGSSRLSDAGVAALEDSNAEVFASVASIWEVAIKWSLRRGHADDMPLSGGEFVAALREAGVKILNITADHAIAVDNLPQLHRDPFDRLLVATAQVERMVLLTSDRVLGEYGESVRVV